MQIGDEDRLKNEIGKIDLLKLGHHGGGGSNTTDYMNTLMPNYVIITNDICGEGYEIYDFIKDNNINYLNITNDEYEICVIIYNNEITFGFGSEGVKKVKYEIFYIPKNKIYSNYLKCKIPVKFKSVEKSVNNWEELKKLIEENTIKGELDKDGNCFIAESLKINLNTENNNNIYYANSPIIIYSIKKIQIVSKNKKIIIKRANTLIDFPLFSVQVGILVLGEENMEGKIIIDGNKDEVESTSYLIEAKRTGELYIYNNVTLCNNLFKISKSVYEYGSAIKALRSKVNIYGGEISNNIGEIYIDKNSSEATLPEKMEQTFMFDMRGVGIYLIRSILNMFGGKICDNEAINNTDIYSNQNSTNGNNRAFSLSQRIYGTGIFGEKSSIFLYKGEISNNCSKNNAKTNLITPIEKTVTNLNGIFSCTNGSAIHLINSELEIFEDFIIQNNSSILNSTINIEKNCKLNFIDNQIKAGQISIYSSKVKIHGGIIRDSKNISNKIRNFSP